MVSLSLALPLFAVFLMEKIMIKYSFKIRIDGVLRSTNIEVWVNVPNMCWKMAVQGCKLYLSDTVASYIGRSSELEPSTAYG